MYRPGVGIEENRKVAPTETIDVAEGPVIERTGAGVRRETVNLAGLLSDSSTKLSGRESENVMWAARLATTT